MSISRGYEWQYYWDSNDKMKDCCKNLFFSGQGFVQYPQNISTEVKASNAWYKDSIIPKNKCLGDIYVQGVSYHGDIILMLIMLYKKHLMLVILM